MIYELLSSNIRNVYQISAIFNGYEVAKQVKEKYKDYDYLSVKINVDNNNQPITIVKCYHNGSVELLFLKKIAMAYIDCLIKIEILTYQDSGQDYDYNDYCAIKPIGRIANLKSLYNVNIIDLTVRYKGDLRNLSKQFNQNENVFFGYRNENESEFTLVFLIHPDIDTVNHFVDVFSNYEKQRDAIQYQQFDITRNIKISNSINQIPEKDLVDIVAIVKNYDVDKIQEIKDSIDNLLDISILIRDYIPYAFIEIIYPNSYELSEMKKILNKIGSENIIKIIYTDFITQNECIYIYPQDENKKLTQEEIDRMFGMSGKFIDAD